jgi:Holliday junction resolvasome RuvABC endonuclease subunit
MNGPRLYLGIDPGKSGGVACVHEDGRPFRWAPMPETESDIYAFLLDVGTASRHEEGHIQVVAAIEKVQPGGLTRGTTGHMGAKSSFVFGYGVGVLKMALIAAEIPFDEVRPQVWQASLGCLTKGDKNVSKARAQQLFPGVKCTHAIADALLIAEWCRRSRIQPAAVAS